MANPIPWHEGMSIIIGVLAFGGVLIFTFVKDDTVSHLDRMKMISWFLIAAAIAFH